MNHRKMYMYINFQQNRVGISVKTVHKNMQKNRKLYTFATTNKNFWKERIISDMNHHVMYMCINFQQNMVSS